MSVQKLNRKMINAVNELQSNTEENLKNEISLARELQEILSDIEGKSKLTLFLTIKDVQELTGFSRHTVDKLFNDPEFPACNYGKSRIVEVHAFIEYFSTSRRKEDSFYWLNIA